VSDSGFDTVSLHTIFLHRFKLLLAIGHTCFNTTLVCKHTSVLQLRELLLERNFHTINSNKTISQLLLMRKTSCATLWTVSWTSAISERSSSRKHCIF